MKKIFLLTALIFSALLCNAQYGNQDSINIPATGYAEPSIKCLLHLPAGYTPTKKYPVIIALGGNHPVGNQLNMLFLTETVAKRIKEGWSGNAVNTQDGQLYEFIVLNPLASHFNSRDFGDWFGAAQVKSMLNWLHANESVDLSRQYLTGLSSGAWSVFKAILTDTSIANQIAAVLPASAEGDGSYPALLCNIPKANIAYWAVYEQGEAFATDNNNYVNIINNCSPKPVISAIQTRLPGIAHDGWIKAYDTSFTPVETGGLNYAQWFLKYKKGAVIQPASSIATGIINGSPFCVTPATGANIVIPFTSVGNFNAGNVYSAQMSDAFGNFANPVNVGSTPSTAHAGSISGTIPANTGAGGIYRFRVISNNPPIVGTPNNVNIVINKASNAIAPSGTQTNPVNANGILLTVIEGSKPVKRLWLDNGVSAIDTSKTFLPFYTTPGTHLITCVSYFACDTVTSNTVTVNVIATTGNKRIVLNKGADNGIYIKGCQWNYKHGDTLVLDAAKNPYSYITLECFDSITIINANGQVQLTNFNGDAIPGGFSFYNCTNIHLTGTGSDDENGFKISTPNYRGVGVNIYGRSAFIEADHLEITRKNAGFWVKMEQAQDSCKASLAFPQWYIHHISIHDNYVHDIAAEGIYGLSTAPNGNAGTQHAVVFCGGLPDSLLPMRGHHFSILYNRFDSTGRAAIQLSAADLDTSEIAFNTVNNIGWDPDLLQGNGISLGTYCRVYVHDNYVNHTKKDGIQAFGALNWIQNNFVHNSGDDGMGHTSSASNIFIASQNGSNPSPKNASYDSTQFIIRNNDLDGNSSGYNIFVETGNGKYKTAGNIICGNTHETKIVRSGINYSSDCSVVPDYVLVYDTLHLRHDTLKVKTFFRDSISLTHHDSAKVVLTIVYYVNGVPSDRHNKIDHWLYNLFDTAHIPVPYDSVVLRKTPIHDSIVVDTLWTNYQLGIFYYNPLGLVPFTNVMDTARYIGVNWLRLPFTRSGSATYKVGTATSNGFHVLLTLDNSANGSAGFGTYADSLTTVAKPDWIGVGNEPAINDSASIAAYLGDVTAIINPAHAKGIKVADGGFERTVVFNYVKDLQNRGKTDSATAIISAFGLNMASPTALYFISKNDSLLNGYSAMNLDAVAMHWGEPRGDTSITVLNNYLPFVARFLTRRTGKPIIITELGITNHNCALLTALIEQAITVVPNGPIIYFDGTGNAGEYIKLQDCFKNTVNTLTQH